MQVEIGKIYEGTVKNITKYGAFVEIPNPDGERRGKSSVPAP